MGKRPSSSRSTRSSKRARSTLSEQDVNRQPVKKDEDIEVDEDRIEPQISSHSRDRLVSKITSSSRQHAIQYPTEESISQGSYVQSRKRSLTQDDADIADDEEEEEEEDDDDEEEDDTNESQASLMQGKNFASSGILLSVRLDRFMSHECFEYSLGPNVNIINGANGSGKSAIVAALQIGLGARANATERGSKIEDHIMHGKDSAVITVKILNRKPPQANDSTSEVDMTYKHDVYGDVIIIERRLVRGRGNSWAVKAKNRRHVKLPERITPKMEIMNIIDHFGFMVNNPVAILTQTKSKAFLSTKSPAQHYKLYVEATLLGPLEDELVLTREVAKEVRRKIKANEESLPITEKKLEKLEAAHREAQELKNIDTLIHEARLIWAWTLVQEEENVLGNFEERTAKEFQPNTDKVHCALQASQEKVTSLTEEQQALSSQLEEATENSKRAALTLRDTHRAAKKVDFDLERQQRRIEEFDAESNDLQHRIVRTRAKMEQARKDHFAGQEQKTRIIQEIQDLASSEEKLRQDIKTTQERESSLLDANLSVEDEKRRARRDFDRLRSEFEEKRRQHMQAKAAARSRDSVARFGQNVPELCRRIEQNRRKFNRMPIGPIGQFIKLRDESWAPAIEVSIGRQTLQTFIVHNSQDASLLQSLIPRGQRPNITIANLDRERYRICPKDMPDVKSYGHQTILETVDIEHNAVFNTLVDQSQIERNVLNESDSDITQLGWSRLPNLNVVWNKRCERAYSRNGSNTFRKAPRNTNAQFLTKDLGPYLQSIERDLERVQREMEDSESCVNELRAKMDKHERSVSLLRREIHDYQRRMREYQHRKTALEDQLSQAENAFESAPYEREIAGYEDSIKEQTSQKVSALSDIEHLEETKKNFNIEIEKAKSAHRTASSETHSLAKSLEVVHKNISNVRFKHRKLVKENEAASAILKRAHIEMAEKRTEIARLMESARGIGECPNNIDAKGFPSERANRKVLALKKKLETEQERRGGQTAQQIEENYLFALKTDKENREKLNKVRSYEEALNIGVKIRQRKLKQLHKSLKSMVRSNFVQFLKIKGHEGHLKFTTLDNGERGLQIMTKMANHTREDGERYVTKDVRSLSGGERSYTTLAFLLSLAEICQNPVRVYDEIDVYQDEATRHASYGTMIDFCTRYLSYRQVIIITPLNLPHIDSSPGVRIVKLKAPRGSSSRGQQTRIDDYANQPL